MFKIFLVILTSICILGTSTVTAFGYSLITNGYYKSSIDLKFDSDLSSMYRTTISDSISEWNSKSISPVNFYTKLDSNNAVYEYLTIGTGIYGVYIPRGVSGNPKHSSTGFHIAFSKAMCEGFNKTWKTRQSVGVHELGHATGLGDLQSGSCIMNQNRNRESIYIPKTDDVNGVKASW